MKAVVVKNIFIFFALAGMAASQAATTVPATLLFFIEQEPGGAPYRTRTIITAGFVRMDDGEDSGDFVLFDRAAGTLYSVIVSDRRILVISRRPMDVKPPADFRHEVARDGARFPAVAGRPVRHYELKTNGKRCYDLYAAADLLPDALAALRQYRAVLAGQQAQTLGLAPSGAWSPCDLANDIFLPSRHLEHGFPVRWVDMTGRRTELVDYSESSVSAALLRLPAGYKRLALEELRRK